MKNIIDVQTGEVKAGSGEVIIKSDAIGSCIAIVAYDSRKKAGAIAHVMLPGVSPEKCTPPRTRYAADAIDVMINEVARLGVNSDDIEVCLVGGANVLKRNNDTIWKDNIDSVVELLKRKNIKIRAEALGGTKRRSVFIDVERGVIHYTDLDGSERVLYKAEEKSREAGSRRCDSLEGNNRDRRISTMKDQDKTKEQLIHELIEMRQRIFELETSGTYQRSLEDSQKASLNIMEDLKNREKELEESQKAYQNIIEDMERAKKELADSQSASLNIMQDLNIAKKKNEEWSETLEQKVEERTRELKESTAQLVQAEKLSALGQLTAGVAHELNQPLNVVKIICQSILRDIHKGQYEKDNVEQDLTEIVEQVNKLAEIIDHMRVFTRRTSGVSREMIDLNMVIKSTLKFSIQQLKGHNIQLVEDLAPDLPQVIGEPIRLEQVFTNLITNARNVLDDCEKQGKRIEIRTYKVDDEQAVAVDVKDNGIGISEELTEKIFQPFYTTKEPGKGTGLGLSVASKIMEEHKGEIKLESKVGEGATFKVILPIA